MSASLVSHTHINVLLTYAKHQALILPHPQNPESCSIDLRLDQTATLFGRELIRENLRSLRYRYGARCGFTADTEALQLERFQFRPEIQRALGGDPGHVGIIKLTHCYDYQACETPDYSKTWAAEFMRQLREHACHHLPGYDGAPWTFNDFE